MVGHSNSNVILDDDYVGVEQCGEISLHENIFILIDSIEAKEQFLQLKRKHLPVQAL